MHLSTKQNNASKGSLNSNRTDHHTFNYQRSEIIHPVLTSAQLKRKIAMYPTEVSGPAVVLDSNDKRN